MANNKIFRADQLSKLYKDCRALNNYHRNKVSTSQTTNLGNKMRL